MKTILRRFRDSDRGNAAVEMSMIAPIIAIVAMLSFNMWSSSTQKRLMEQSLRVASQYYFGGGSSDTEARNVALSSWTGKPTGADVQIDRLYQCGETVVASAATVCSNGFLASAYARLTATGTITTLRGEPTTKTVTKIIRVG